jgi:hypothetical protein
MALEIDPFWVPNGHYIGVAAKIASEQIATAYAKVLLGTFTQYPDFSLGSITASNSSSWTEIKDGDVEILKPEQQDLVYHIFYGQHPVNTRVYEQMGNKILRNIRGLPDKDSAKGGWVGGIMNEPNNPSPKTEFATIYELTARKFSMYNPQSASITGRLNFMWKVYLVQWIKDRRLVNEFETMQRKFTPLPLGDSQYIPTAPEWLKKHIGEVK